MTNDTPLLSHNFYNFLQIKIKTHEQSRGNHPQFYTPSGLGVIHELDAGWLPSERSGLGDIFPPDLELSRPSVAISWLRWSDYWQQGCDGNTGLDSSKPHALLPLGLGWRYADLMTFMIFPWQYVPLCFFYHMSFFTPMFPCFIFSSIFDLSHGCACHCCIITNSSHDLFLSLIVPTLLLAFVFPY